MINLFVGDENIRVIFCQMTIVDAKRNRVTAKKSEL